MRLSRAIRLTAALAASVVFAACGGDSTVPTQLDVICNGTLAVTVTQGSTTPGISWTPGCRVQALTVENIATGEVMWAVSRDVGMSSPITYGLVPAGASVGVAAVTLVRGTAYGVSLSKGVVSGAILGEQTFIP